MEGRGRGLIQGTIRKFSWRDKKNHENLHQESVSGQIFEPETFGIQNRRHLVDF
jgi:hypothetical protein